MAPALHETITTRDGKDDALVKEIVQIKAAENATKTKLADNVERAERMWRFLSPVLMGVAFAAALFVLSKELKHVQPSLILDYTRVVPTSSLALAMFWTSVSYFILCSYDYIGLRFIKSPVPYRTSFPASLVAYALSYNLGFAALSGTALRLRLFTTWGLSAFDVAKAAVFGLTTFWLGLIALAGLVFLIAPPQDSLLLAFLPSVAFQIVGVFLLGIAAFYFLACAKRRKPVRVLRFSFELPSPKIALLQIVLSLTEWTASSGVMYIILKNFVAVDFISFIGVYIVAMTVGALSAVPAGLGVVESLVVLMLGKQGNMAALVGGLILYRVIYYLVPFCIGLGLLAWLESKAIVLAARRYNHIIESWVETAIPMLSASLTFIAGIVLLMSGATPTLSGRLGALERMLPLAFIEGAHLLGSMVGVLLLFLARGLMRRLSGAFAITLALLLSGAFLSILKGFDYEEALVLASSFAMLAPCRSYFYRKSSLLDSWASPRWVMAVTLVVASSISLAIFAQKNMVYADISWWALAFDRHVPVAIRASFCATATLLAFGVGYLIRPPRSRRPIVQVTDATIFSIVASSPKTYANLALLNDKEFTVNEEKTGFIMYAKAGSCWIAMGDPIAPENAVGDLIWTFREQCDHAGARPVYYQVEAAGLHHYVDAGFDLLKIGEEAVVSLDSFSLSGHRHKQLRNTIHQMDRRGLSFNVVPASAVSEILPVLKLISDEWLAKHGGAEKGFSLGRFSSDYLQHFPMAVIRSEWGIEAFANIWTTTPKGELSCDLMRYRSGAPKGVMDYLFVQLMQWGKAEGFRTFNLGMAPLSGVEVRSHMPVWSKLESAIYRYGSRWYDFQGLRAYKEKFDPQWSPKYIACTGGLTMPATLLDVAVLIGGGVRRTFLR